MARDHGVGLDELMIVNPGTPDAVRVVRLGRGLGRMTPEPRAAGGRPADGHRRRDVPVTTRRRLFLGATGALYEVIE